MDTCKIEKKEMKAYLVLVQCIVTSNTQYICINQIGIETWELCFLDIDSTSVLIFVSERQCCTVRAEQDIYVHVTMTEMIVTLTK